MSRARWRRRPGRGAVLMGTAALLSIAAATQSAAPSSPVAAAVTDCSSPAGTRLRAVAAEPSAAARVRVADRLGSLGQYVGRHLEVTSARGTTAKVDLPSESSVSRPDANIVVYTRQAGPGSEVRAIELLDGCDMLLVETAGIARSAILDAQAGAVYVHALTPNRSDAGVIRHALDGGGFGVVVPPVPDDSSYGRTFGTELVWSTDKATLAVQSCAMEACRTRLLDVASGAVEMLDARPHGAIIGVTPSDVVAYDACHWQPCAVLAIERDTGDVEILADEAWDAHISASADGVAVVSMTTSTGTVEVAP